MSSCCPRTTYINSKTELYPSLMGEEEGKSVQDLLRLYSPNGPIRKSISYFGGTGISHIPSVNSSFYKVNHIVKQMLGIPSLDTGLDQSIVAGGKGHGLVPALLSALGESVERFAGVLKAYAQDTHVEFGSYRALTNDGINCLHPDELPLFHEEQYKQPTFLFEPFEEDTFLSWIEGERLRSGEKIWVPAQLGLFFYLSRDEEGVIAYSSSAGLAAHIDRPRAIYGGITELIERDGMMCSWYTGIPPKRIRMDRALDSPARNRLQSMLANLPGEVACYDHRLDMPEIPVISTLQLVPYLKKYRYYAGGASAIDADEAMQHALVEYGQSEAQLKLATYAPDRGWSVGADRHFDVSPDKPTEEMTTFLEHLGYYGYTENKDKLSWFLEDGEDIPFSELPTAKGFADHQEKLDALVEILDGHGIDPIVIDYTPPQMEQLKVTKVIIPELLQPHVSQNPYLGHPRLYELPQKLGLRDEPLTYETLVDGPVPFP